jgi:hypothetical protein
MAIHRLLKNRAFGPDEIKVLTAAYEQALRLSAPERALPVFGLPRLGGSL